jgi:hypothetical protein
MRGDQEGGRMNAPVATFSERRHLYQDAGVVVPSVTQILQMAGFHDPSRIPTRNRIRGAALGTAVHHATHFLDENDLDPATVAPQAVPYLDAYRLFKDETGFVPVAIEQQGIAEHDGLKFGYCIDRSGLYQGELIQLELKTAATRERWWKLQTAGYADATEHEGRRAVLHLMRDRKYKLLWHDEADDFRYWRGALVVAHGLLAHGRKLPR